MKNTQETTCGHVLPENAIAAAAKNQSENAPRCYARTATAIFDLLKSIEDGMIDCATATWSDCGSLSAARAKLVEAAQMIGAITVEESREDHGVRI